jgi:hypothetical protein
MSELIEYKRNRKERTPELLQQLREEVEEMGLYE